MRPSEALANNWQAICEATKRFNAASARVFGSVAWGEDRPDSDLDILVDALPGSMLLSLGRLLEELEQLLRGTPVHLVTPGDFTEKVRTRVLVEAKPV
jgi:predicted nucleotidyltransferase